MTLRFAASAYVSSEDPISVGWPEKAGTDPKPRAVLDRGVSFFPIFSLLPVVVVGEAKAAGLLSIAGIDTTAISVAFLLVTAGLTFLKNPRYPAKRMIPMFLLTAVVVGAITRGSASEYQALKVRDFIVVVLLTVCIPILLRGVRDYRGLAYVWIVGGSIAAGLVLVVGGSPELYGRAGIGTAVLGPAYLAAAALIASAALLGERLLRPVLAVPVMILSGAVLVTIGSRGPLLACVGGVVVWFLLAGRLNGRSVFVLMAFFGALAIGGLQESGMTLHRSIFDDAARSTLWESSWQTFLAHPLVGVGWGGFSEWTGSIHDYPHNIFMESLVELGVLGFLAVLLVLAAATLRVLSRRDYPEARVLGAVAAGMFVGQQFSSDLTNRVFWIALIPCLMLRGLPDLGGARLAARSAPWAAHAPQSHSSAIQRVPPRALVRDHGGDIPSQHPPYWLPKDNPARPPGRRRT